MKLIQTILKTSFLFLVLIFAVSTGCQQQNYEEETTSNGFDKEKAESFIDSINTTFAEKLRSGDSVALASYYTSDAELMFPNNETMKGKDIISGWSAVINSGVRDLTLTPADLTGDENFIIGTGAYELKDQNKTTIDQGKYVVIYKKENGKWKKYRDIVNSSLPHGK